VPNGTGLEGASRTTCGELNRTTCSEPAESMAKKEEKTNP